jgi:hypothetical protein
MVIHQTDDIQRYVWKSIFQVSIVPSFVPKTFFTVSSKSSLENGLKRLPASGSIFGAVNVVTRAPGAHPWEPFLFTIYRSKPDDRTSAMGYYPIIDITTPPENGANMDFEIFRGHLFS